MNIRKTKNGYFLPVEIEIDYVDELVSEGNRHFKVFGYVGNLRL